MKKVIKLIKAYDDVHLREDGTEVEADVEVRVTLGEEEILVLDLTEEHAATFRSDLAPWLAYAHPAPQRPKYTRRAAGSPGLPVARRPTAGMTRQEGNDFLAGLRQWAAGIGRDNEISYKGKSGYAYGQQLVDDYRARLKLPKAS